MHLCPEFPVYIPRREGAENAKRLVFLISGDPASTARPMGRGKEVFWIKISGSPPRKNFHLPCFAKVSPR